MSTNNTLAPVAAAAHLATAPRQQTKPQSIAAGHTALPNGAEGSLFGHGGITAICIGQGVFPGNTIAALVQAVTTPTTYVGYPVLTKKRITLVLPDAPTTRHLERLYSQLVDSNVLRIVGPTTDAPPDYLQPDGCAIAKAAFPAACEVGVLLMPPVHRKGPLDLRDLACLLSAVQTRCQHLVLVFITPTAETALQLPGQFDVVFNISACEPDHGFTSATITVAAPGTFLAALGKPPVIDNIRLSEHGEVEHSVYDCVSPDAMSREIARLQDKGMTMDQIGDLLEISKSTVSRRLSALPFKPKQPLVGQN